MPLFGKLRGSSSPKKLKQKQKQKEEQSVVAREEEKHMEGTASAADVMSLSDDNTAERDATHGDAGYVGNKNTTLLVESRLREPQVFRKHIVQSVHLLQARGYSGNNWVTIAPSSPTPQKAKRSKRKKHQPHRGDRTSSMAMTPGGRIKVRIERKNAVDAGRDAQRCCIAAVGSGHH